VQEAILRFEFCQDSCFSLASCTVYSREVDKSNRSTEILKMDARKTFAFNRYFWQPAHKTIAVSFQFNF